ncbi:MAG: PPC domain-containing protein, partial [Sedimentisphaerales bacterium]|nr:PPC domain-containing protein [Sedimentisphaerales bacterium]
MLNLEKLEDRVLLSVNLPVESILADGSVYEGDFSSLADVDSFRFTAQAGHTYHIRCESRGTEAIPTDGSGLPDLYEVTGFTDPVVNLYDSTGTNIIASDDDSGLESGAYIQWTAPSSGTYYIETSVFQHSLKDFQPGNYSLSLTEGNADWTVMFYYDFDNNLEDSLTAEFAGILAEIA